MDLDFYSGHEGEPEIVITRHLEGTRRSTIRMWACHFDEIVSSISPGPTGWRGFTMAYHLHTGWYDEDCWFDPDIHETLHLLEEVGDKIRGQNPLYTIWSEYCNLLKEAIATGGKVSIEYF